VEFRRIPGLPPYVFTIIDSLKIEARRAGRDVVDLGFGNPDIPSPDLAVDKLAEAAHNARNHRYSASRGIPKLRQAAAELYRRRFEVVLDPDSEIISTIGAKEGFSHLMWVLLQPGDAALVPSPSYPIHIWGPYFAGADARQVAIGGGEDYIANVMNAYDMGWPKPRVVVLSFPHNPTTATVELADLQRLVDWARERDVVLVHDFAYAETAFDGWSPPSILQCEGAKDVAVELYSMTKIAATVTLNEAVDYPQEVNAIYESRRNALCDGLDRIGWDIPRPRGTMFAWAPIPEPYAELGSIEFSKLIINECDVAVSPGVGFGPAGDAFVRFALIENEQRIGQAVRQLKRGLTKLG
jgi:alanine-synthesizing transaminase